jgi:hypothetical protein
MVSDADSLVVAGAHLVADTLAHGHVAAAAVDAVAYPDRTVTAHG